MKTILLGLVGLVALLVLVVLGMAMTRPDVLHIERSAVIAATPADIQPYVTDYTRFVTWNPWSGLDPNQTTTLSDPPSGEGARYAWKGNDQVGEGRLTTTGITAAKVTQRG